MLVAGFRSVPASPSHGGISGRMKPQSLLEEGSPTPDACPYSTVSFPAIRGAHLEVNTRQPAPVSPGNPGKQ